MKQKLFGLTLTELLSVVKELKLPKYTAMQIANWLYKKDISSIEEMSNLSKNARKQLEENYVFGLSNPTTVQTSADGTKKYLYNIGVAGAVEAAYIPEENRSTLCVSSQIGCKMGCEFCMTGKQGFKGNLTTNEILNQIRSLPEYHKLTNLVYMGMGEPLDNLKAVMQSVEILTAEWGMGWSKKRITVSTIGVVPAMKQFLLNSEAHLAVSLHSPFEDERKSIMPISNTYTIDNILSEIKNHDFSKQRRISFEYIVFNGMNDTYKHVNQLAKILVGINCRINLIRFHAIPNTQLKGTSEERLQKFKIALNAKGITTTIRASRGQDIDAACGLLSTKINTL